MNRTVRRLLCSILSPWILLCVPGSPAEEGSTPGRNQPVPVAPVPAAAAAVEKRLALIMGVSNYGRDARFADLPGIDKDLAAMRAVLTKLGFTLVEVPGNPTLTEAEAAIDAFGRKLKEQGGVGLFYFSGHGAEYEGKNYLIPRGARIGETPDVKEQAVAVQRVLHRMESSGAQVNIVFLDCCRNELTKSGTDGGLAAMQAKGTFIGFATAAEKAAAASTDGSPYTSALVRRMAVPGISILDMHTHVTSDVESATRAAGAEQTPFMYSGLTSPFFFTKGDGKQAAGGAEPPELTPAVGAPQAAAPESGRAYTSQYFDAGFVSLRRAGPDFEVQFDVTAKPDRGLYYAISLVQTETGHVNTPLHEHWKFVEAELLSDNGAVFNPVHSTGIWFNNAGIRSSRITEIPDRKPHRAAVRFRPAAQVKPGGTFDFTITLRVYYIQQGTTLPFDSAAHTLRFTGLKAP